VTTMQEPAMHGWRIEDSKHMRMTGYPGKVKSTSWSVKGRWLASSGANAAILWPFTAKDGPMGKPPLQLGPYGKLVTKVACHPSEEVAAIGYEDGLVMAVRFEDHAEVVLHHPAGSAVSALAWAPDGLSLAVGTEDGAAALVDIAA
jgi:WD40 repeat protein